MYYHNCVMHLAVQNCPVITNDILEHSNTTPLIICTHSGEPSKVIHVQNEQKSIVLLALVHQQHRWFIASKISRLAQNFTI